MNKNESGSTLVMVLIMLFSMTMFIVISTQEQTNALSAQRAIQGAMNAELSRERILDALRMGYYNELLNVRGNSTPANRFFLDTNMRNVISTAATILGGSISNNYTIIMPPSAGSQTATVTATIPGSGLDASAGNNMTSITSTRTWLDGMSAVQRLLPITITIHNISNYKTNSTTTSNALIFVDIPARSLGVSSLGNLTVSNGIASTISGGVYSGGNLNANNAIVTGNVVVGDKDNSAVNSSSLGSISGIQTDGTSYRYVSEVLSEKTSSTSRVRSSDDQRAVSLGTAISRELVFASGRANGTTAADNLLRAQQPYYRVAQNNRVVGSHSTPSTYTLSAGSGDNVNAATLPTWATVESVTNNNIVSVAVRLNLSSIPLDTAGVMNVFIQSQLNGTLNNYNNFRVLIPSTTSLPAGCTAVNIITPNDLVFLGDFNINNIPVNIMANQVYYGQSVRMSQIIFSGSVADMNVGGTGGTINLNNASGVAPTTTTATLAANTNSVSNAENYYQTVLIGRY